MKGKKSGLKWIIIGLVVVVLVFVIFSLLGNRNNVNPNTNVQTETGPKNYTETAEGAKINTSEDVSKNKQVGDVLLEQSKIVFENGMSKLTSKVTNNAVAKDNLRFKVRFLANDGTVIAESVGFVGQIRADEVKYIDSYITLDVSNAKDVQYELM